LTVDSAASRTFEFPDAAVRGRIYARPRREPGDSLLGEIGWRRVGEAAGVLTAPTGVDLKLVINPRFAADLSWLSALRDAEIRAIELPAPARNAEQLRPLASLPDLAAVALVTPELAPAAIAALATIPTIRELRLGDARGDASIAADMLAPLDGIPLWNLQLYNVALRPGALEQFASLTTLRLTHTRKRFAASPGLAALGEPPRLQHLQLAGGSLHADDMRQIGRLSGLVTLDMVVAGLRGGAAGWDALTALRELRIDGLHTGEELGFVRDLAALESLTLPGIELGQTGIEAVTGLSTLRALDLDGAQLLSDELPALYGLVRLEHLNLSRIEVAVVDLTGIGALTALRSLLLEDVASPKDVTPLRRLTDLERLFLGGGPLRGVTGALDELFRLRELSLYRCGLTDRDVAGVGRLRHLQFLALAENPITDATAAAIAPLEELRELKLSTTDVTDACFGAIARLERLRSLDLRHVRLSGHRLAELGALQALETLKLTGVHAPGLVQIAALSSLRLLVLDHVELDVEGARAIGQLPSLQHLELVATPVPEDVARELAGAVRLQTLSVTGGRISGEGFAWLAHLPALRHLDLSRSQIDDAVVASIGALRSLETIDLTDTDVTDAGLLQFASATSLERIAARGRHLSRDGLAELAARLPMCSCVD
jgi:Leucine-rich repeat (LRR) protein